MSIEIYPYPEISGLFAVKCNGMLNLTLDTLDYFIYNFH
jgi:hypothetical protein